VRFSTAKPLPSLPAPTLFGWALAVAAVLAILILPRPFDLLAIPAVAAGLFYLLVPAAAAVFLVASVPVQATGAVSAGGVEWTATKVALGAAVGALAVHLVTRRETIRWSSILVPYCAYLLVMVASLHDAQFLRPGIAEIYRWSTPLFAFVLVLYVVRSRRAALAIPIAIGAGVLWQATSGVIQSLLELGPASFAAGGGLSRAYGSFGKPNTYAAYLELSAPLLLALAGWGFGQIVEQLRAYRKTRLHGMVASRAERAGVIWWTGFTLWMAVCALAGLVGIVLSFSRGAWLGTAAGLLAMLLVSARGLPIARVAVAGVVAVVLLTGGMRYAPEAVQERYEQLVSQVRLFDARQVIVTPENFAAVERMAHWQTGIAMFQAEPLLGVGVGNFNGRFRDFQVHPGFPTSAGHAHNYYIQAAAETGTLGLAVYLWLIGTALAIALRAARTTRDALSRAVGLGAVGVTVALMVHNVVENLHVLSLGIQLAAIWALAVLALYNPPWSGVAQAEEGTNSA